MKPLYGNAVVGQSGGPTAAINATLAGVIQGAQKAHRECRLGTLYGMRYGISGLLNDRLLDLSPVWEDGDKLSLLSLTPAAALGSCRIKLPKSEGDDKEGVYARLLERFRKYDIRYFFYIGGNDSMDTVAKLSAYTASKGYELRCIGVPKTIDNDLEGTDHTPGFGSAAKYVATVCSEIVCDCAVYDVKAVTVVEIMGRDAGWLTSAAALPRLSGDDAPDLIYLPERPFTLDGFYRDVASVFEKKPNVVVAVSEGIRFPDGAYVGESAQSGAADIFGHKYLAGAGRYLASALKEHFGCKTRAVELSLPQRCASHLLSGADISESLRIGKAAVRYALAGQSGKMITLSRLPNGRMAVGAKDVHEIANKIRTVPASYINKAGNHITDDGLAYLAPLVKGEKHVPFLNGTPLHFKF